MVRQSNSQTQKVADDGKLTFEEIQQWTPPTDGPQDEFLFYYADEKRKNLISLTQVK